MTKPNPFRDMPFPGAGGSYHCVDGVLTPDAPVFENEEKLIGLDILCDEHDAAEAAANPTPPRPPRTRRNTAEQE